MFKVIFIAIFIIAIPIYFRVRFLLKKYYPELYLEICGKRVTEHSMALSLRFIRFSLFESEWESIDNNTMLFWLKVYRLVSVIYYGLIVGGVIYFFFLAYTQ